MANPRIDVELGKRLLKLKKTGANVRGLASFLSVHDVCWRDQARDESIPMFLRTNEKLLREARKRLFASIRNTAKNLKAARLDAYAIFAEHGLSVPALKKLDDATLASEATRLRKVLLADPRFKQRLSLGVKQSAERIQSSLRSIEQLRAREAAAPAAAKVRVKKWTVALEKFRKDAERAGVKIRGL